MSAPTVVFWDSETQLIGPGLNAPPMSCLSACEDDDPPFLLHWTQAGVYLRDRLMGGSHFVGANLPFDWCVAAANFPELLHPIFQAYREDRCQDVIGRQKLLDTASGCYRGYLNSRNYWVAFNYDLAALTRRHTDLRLNKDKEIQLTFGPLRDLPLEQWPAAHREYAVEDAVATRGVWRGQDDMVAKNPGVNLLGNQYEQARADFALRLMSAWGLRTDQDSVDILEAATREVVDRLQAELQGYGLVKPDGVRDTKAAKAWMLKACGWDQEVTAGPIPEGEKKGPPIYAYSSVGVHDMPEGGQKKLHLTDSNDVSLASEACEASEDPVLALYGEFGDAKSVLSKDVKALREGVLYPIHTYYGFAASGRTTSSKPNVQNWRRLPGIRETFRPRPGKVYAQADVEGLELCTLAQVCITVLGRSALGDAINGGMDVHTDLACAILNITYDEGKRRKKYGELPIVRLFNAWKKDHAGQEPTAEQIRATTEEYLQCIQARDFDNARQSAKVANFGFPGGLGVKNMVAFAKSTYGVIITEKECRALKDRWLSKWPEMEDYFRWVSSQMTNPDGTGQVVQLFSGRIRGGVTYCSACNTFFQGLGADGAKAAAWGLAEACYDLRDNVMFGSRPVFFGHDEFITETDDTPRAHDVAVEQERIMVSGIQKWVPDVIIKAPPLLMRYWSKNAKAVYDAAGRLMPWE